MKGKNKASTILAILALIIGMLAIQLPIPVYATGSVTVALPNVSWTYPDRDVGQILVMDLTITNDTASPLDNVTSWEADFSWDPSILECTGVIEGSFLSSAAGIGNTSFTAGTINNVAGTVTGANVTITTAAYATVDGTGILAILVFKVIDCGSTSVTVVSCDATGPQGTVTVTRVNGSFSMSVTVSLPSTTWTYPDRDVGQILVMDFAIETPAGWSGVSSWKANFSWNPSILECTAIIEGSFLSSAAGIGNTSFTAGTINNVAGTITGANGTITTVATATGSGTLAILVFKVIDCGSTPVTITDVEVLGSEIPATTVDGYFEFGATLELDNIPWTYPDHNISDTFEMNLTIRSAVLFAWQAGLSFDPDVVNVVSVALGVGFYLNQTGPIQALYDSSYINNTAGTVDVFGCTLLGGASAPATGSGGATVATITFNVTGHGKTAILITDAKAFGSEIPVTTVDGYFEFGGTMDFVPSLAGPVTKGTTFSINLTIYTTELFAWQAGLSFDPNILEVISITGGEGYYLNQTGPVQWIYDSSYINNTAGTVDVFGCTLLGGASAPATGSGGATVATITFKVLSYISTSPYCTTIEITDAKAFGSEIPVTPEHGKFRLKIGDVNADVNVSGADIVLVLINLGAVPPKPTECDINNDNNVSGADIVLVLINLGGYPPCP